MLSPVRHPSAQCVRTERPRLHRTADAYETVDLSGTAAIRDQLQAIARRGKGRMVGPLRMMTEDHRAQTMAGAIGTCGARTVTGVAVVVEGNAPASSSVVLVKSGRDTAALTGALRVYRASRSRAARH